MDAAVWALAACLILISIGALILLGLVRGARKETVELRQSLEVAKTNLEELRIEKSKLVETVSARDASLRDRGERITTLEQKVEAAQEAAKLATSRADKLASSEIALRDQVEKALAEIKSHREELRASQTEARTLSNQVKELETKLGKEREAGEEKLKLLTGVREDMENRFKQLADETMRRHGEDFSKLNREKLEALLTPFREHVGRFEEELRNVHQGAAKERERLKVEIEQLTKRSEEISREAVSLTRALKGEKQRQGAWGEMILSSLLERSGLRQGAEYEVQVSRRNEDGQQYRPDVVVRLPGQKRLVIDSKVSLVAYEATVNAEDPAEQAQALREHVRAVRTHIDTLSVKGYHELEEGSVDYVVMFMPIEGALSEALREQGDLTTYALEKGVTIATPTTLMMALRTIEHVWAVERRNANAEAIADRAGKLYDKVVGFVQEMENVGQRLTQAQQAHNQAMGRLARGSGNVLSQVEKLKVLGAKTTKSIGVDFDEDPEEAASEAPPAISGKPEAAE